MTNAQNRARRGAQPGGSKKVDHHRRLQNGALQRRIVATLMFVRRHEKRLLRLHVERQFSIHLERLGGGPVKA